MQVYRLTLLLSLFTLLLTSLQSQQNVGIGTSTPHASAALEIAATTKGVLIPRAETSAIVSPATGLLVFQPSDLSFYFYTGTAWRKFDGLVVDSDGDTRVSAGNHAGAQDSVLVEIDNFKKLVLKRNAGGDLIAQPIGTRSNTYYGFNAGRATSTGQFNTAFGELSQALITEGGYNTSLGSHSLGANLSGNNNVAIGYNVLKSNTTGSGNIAIGRSALGSNITKGNMVAIGDSALYFNEVGATLPSHSDGNVAIGSKAMLKNTIGNSNTAIGTDALKNNISGTFVTAVGAGALFSVQSGLSNTAFGFSSLYALTTGTANIGIGYQAFGTKTTGSTNIGIGWRAGYGNVSGSNNIFLGTQAGYEETGSDKLYIENSNATANDALIYGEFNTNFLRFNAHAEINAKAPLQHGLVSKILAPPGTNYDAAALRGESRVDDFYGYGVYGEGGYVGVYGGVAAQGSASYFGVRGSASGGTSGTKYALYGSASGTGTNYGVFGSASGGTTNYGGYFLGKGYFSDLVGIGTQTPAKHVHVLSNDDPTILLQSNGTDANSGKVSMRQSNFTGMDMYYDGGAADALIFESFTTGTSNGRKMTMDLNGNIGIGITENIAAGHKLSVNGKIACTEVRVQPQNQWPDYVFAEEYNLMPLSELKTSIADNKHLPGIPSANQIETYGLHLGDMQVRMMEKIEELTLYILQLHEEIEKLKKDKSEEDNLPNSTVKQ